VSVTRRTLSIEDVRVDALLTPKHAQQPFTPAYYFANGATSQLVFSSVRLSTHIYYIILYHNLIQCLKARHKTNTIPHDQKYPTFRPFLLQSTHPPKPCSRWLRRSSSLPKYVTCHPRVTPPTAVAAQHISVLHSPGCWAPLLLRWGCATRYTLCTAPRTDAI
jgi:hypothetical protein